MMKVIAKLIGIEAVDIDMDLRNSAFKVQKLSFHIPVYPQHEMFSFHVPMKREGEPFKVGYHYNIVITDVSEEELKQLEGGK